MGKGVEGAAADALLYMQKGFTPKWKGWRSIYRNGSPNQKKLGRTAGLWAGEIEAIELCCADLEDEIATGLLGDEQLSATYDALALHPQYARLQWAYLHGHERLRKLSFRWLELYNTLAMQFLVARTTWAPGKRCKRPTSPGRDNALAVVNGAKVSYPNNLTSNRQLYAPWTASEIAAAGMPLPIPRSPLLGAVRLRIPVVREQWSSDTWAAYYPSMTGRAGWDTPQPAVAVLEGVPSVGRPSDQAVYCGELPVTVGRSEGLLQCRITGRVGRPDGPVREYAVDLRIPTAPSRRTIIGAPA